MDSNGSGLILNEQQQNLICSPLNSKIFLEGPAGTGKSTAGVERLIHLLKNGVRGDSILLLTPQRTLAIPYINALNSLRIPSGGQITYLTIGGLAQRMVNLFWPLVSEKAGFSNPYLPPTFLTLETAQYYMAYLVRPLLKEGYFESLIMDRNRLYSQILDNLSKAAVVGFPHTEFGERLKAAWIGEPVQLHVYDDAQVCANKFRAYCLAKNLLDFSLQMEVFMKYLWPLDSCQKYLTRTYRNLLYDNIEEDSPVAQDILGEWLRSCESALLIFDQDAGFRKFLGADPDHAYLLKDHCDVHHLFTDPISTSLEIRELEFQLTTTLGKEKPSSPSVDPRPALIHATHRFFPEMINWTAAQISELVHDHGIPPGEIAVLSPYLSDSLRFALINRLDQVDIPTRTYRPSRSLRDEPASQCLTTLTTLAHPEWGFHLSKFDVAYALMQAIDGLDLIRAQILAEIVLRKVEGVHILSSFERIAPAMQERITFLLGTRYEILRSWIQSYQDHPPKEIDHFFSLLFGEVLSQPGFGFHANFDAGKVTANLIESIHKFRRVVGQQLEETGVPLGKEYIQMLQEGVISALYLQQWEQEAENTVLITPAHTFLMINQPVSIQFWLDISSRGWSERINQPLTHPYVLSRQWTNERRWTDVEEVNANQNSLIALVHGLLRRCRNFVYLGMSEFSEQGYEQRGPLLRAFNNILQQYSVLEN